MHLPDPISALMTLILVGRTWLAEAVAEVAQTAADALAAAVGAAKLAAGLTVVLVSPVFNPLTYPVRSSTLLLATGGVLSNVLGLFADYAIAVLLMAVHLIAGYVLDAARRADTPRRQLVGLVALNVVLAAAGSVVAWQTGVLHLYLVCALVTMVHLLVSRVVPHG